MENRHVKNRKSPQNEADYQAAYKQLNPSADKKGDGKDIAAVTTKDGERGHALVQESHNRSHDKNFHRGEDFISDTDLKKQMNSKK